MTRTIAVLGGHGFVGQAYTRLFKRLGIQSVVIDRHNYDRCIGTAFDVLINANGNSKKFIADTDPKLEFLASVLSVNNSLEDFRVNKYVFLSTGDVYPKQETPEITKEDCIIDPGQLSRYGLHKYLAEIIVRSVKPNSLIVRMGGFVGPGLAKNAIFDMLSNQPIRLHPDSELQFISTDHAAALIWSLVEKDVHGTVNLGALGVVRLSDLYDRIGTTAGFRANAPRVRFELSTEKLSQLVDAPLPTTIDEVNTFLAQSRK
jgi:nucleoside-diphosphate-sugar epimerase